MSFKLVPFESLGAVSYLPSIVTIAVSLTIYEILSVKVYSVTLKTGLGVVLKMTPFDRAYTTFCWSAVVNIAQSGTIFELFDIE